MAVVILTTITMMNTRGSISKEVTADHAGGDVGQQEVGHGPGQSGDNGKEAGVVELGGIDVQGSRPTEPRHKKADAPQDIQMKKGDEMKAVLGPRPGVAQKRRHKGLGLGVDHDGQERRHHKDDKGVDGRVVVNQEYKELAPNPMFIVRFPP